MQLSKLVRVLIVPAVLAIAGAGAGTALAKPTSPQTHHCKLADGTMDLAKTHKQCTAAKGTWFKDVPASGTPTTPATPAPTTPAPSAPAPTKPAPAPTAPAPAPTK